MRPVFLATAQEGSSHSRMLRRYYAHVGSPMVHSGRGDAARPWLPFSDVVASARVRAPQEDFSHNQMLRRYYAHVGFPMVHRVGAVMYSERCRVAFFQHGHTSGGVHAAFKSLARRALSN